MIIEGYIPVDFWKSMEEGREPTDPLFFSNKDIKNIEKRFNNFNSSIKNKLPENYSKPPQNFRIPPIIHFIWLGSSIPEKIDMIINSWRVFNPGWKIIIWTDKEVETFSWTKESSKNFYEKATHYAEKSDILRYEILYQFGGIYSDTDVVCLKSFNDLISSGVTLLGGLEVNQVYASSVVWLCNAVIGCIKNSPIIKYCIENLKSSVESSDNLVFRTGPRLFTLACLQGFESENVLILPCSYFYPFPFFRDNSHWSYSSEQILTFVRPESMTLHLWEGTWI